MARLRDTDPDRSIKTPIYMLPLHNNLHGLMDIHYSEQVTDISVTTYALPFKIDSRQFHFTNISTILISFGNYGDLVT